MSTKALADELGLSGVDMSAYYLTNSRGRTPRTADCRGLCRQPRLLSRRLPQADADPLAYLKFQQSLWQRLKSCVIVLHEADQCPVSSRQHQRLILRQQSTARRLIPERTVSALGVCAPSA